LTHPPSRVAVPVMLGVGERAYDVLDDLPATLVVKRALNRRGDERAALTPTHAAVESTHDLIVQTYVQTHGHTLAHVVIRPTSTVSRQAAGLSRRSALRAHDLVTDGSGGVWTRLTPPARPHGPPVRSGRAGGVSHAQPLTGSRHLLGRGPLASAAVLVLAPAAARARFVAARSGPATLGEGAPSGLGHAAGCGRGLAERTPARPIARPGAPDP
jgi:hypothetical protein